MRWASHVERAYRFGADDPPELPDDPEPPSLLWFDELLLEPFAPALPEPVVVRLRTLTLSEPVVVRLRTFTLTDGSRRMLVRVRVSVPIATPTVGRRFFLMITLRLDGAV
jgi:hypothetical protein